MSTDLRTQFLHFCRSKPADERYRADSPQHCALAQFGKPGLHSGNCEAHGVPFSVYYAAVPDLVGETGFPTTFGALAARLEAAR